MPYSGIEHAGGEFILRHLKHLAESMEVSILAYATDFNAEAKSRMQLDIEGVMLTPQATWGTTLPGRVLKRLVRDLLPLVPDVDYTWGFIRSGDADSYLRNTDVIEIQYVEFFHLIPYIRSRNKNVRIVGVVHDVVSERFKRVLNDRPQPHIRIFGPMTLPAVRRLERWLCNKVDELLVFNEDTQTKLRALGVSSPITIARPPLTDTQMPSSVSEASSVAANFLFVGAFDRPENNDAALWFLEKVWPIIQNRLPWATFCIAGANPSRRLMMAANSSNGVTVTGYVRDLAGYYQSAGVIVVPLLRGAGVKFKTVTGMLWGKPIVSTSIGAEGIADNSYYVAVTDDPTKFALAAIRAVVEPAFSQPIAQRAHSWAHDHHSDSKFRQAVRSAYVSPLASDQ
ncbi:hypothetical protein CH299_07295 [Rhodococcus sp. 14-2686-1-2]|nr:hypothetical protein CH299_07295 [Rhodococcus sp. 14-2686-1-2]